MLPGICGLAGRVSTDPYGPELIVNGDMSSQGGWTLAGDSGPDITGGVLTFYGGSGDTNSYARRAPVTIVNGARYLLAFDFVNQGGSFYVASPDGNPISANATTKFSQIVTATSNSFTPNIYDNFYGGAGTFDNYSLRQVL